MSTVALLGATCRMRSKSSRERGSSNTRALALTDSARLSVFGNVSTGMEDLPGLMVSARRIAGIAAPETGKGFGVGHDFRSGSQELIARAADPVQHNSHTAVSVEGGCGGDGVLVCSASDTACCPQGVDAATASNGTAALARGRADRG